MENIDSDRVKQATIYEQLYNRQSQTAYHGLSSSDLSIEETGVIKSVAARRTIIMSPMMILEVAIGIIF